MKRTAINPSSWSQKFGFHQGEIIEGATRQLNVSGQGAMDAEGQPVHQGDMRAQFQYAMDNLVSVLKVADMTLTDVISRRIEPLSLQNITDGWMLSGWCDLRQDFRTFRLDLLCDPCVTEHRFVEKPDRSLSVFLQKVRAESVMRPSAPA